MEKEYWKQKDGMRWFKKEDRNIIFLFLCGKENEKDASY